jgi:hypothetical protein
MTCWQRSPPSLHLTATGELARWALTGTVGEAAFSPLSGIVMLSEDSEDGEQNNDGKVGLRGDAVNVSDTERRRYGGETSSTGACVWESSGSREGDAGWCDERGRDVCDFAATGEASKCDILEGEGGGVDRVECAFAFSDRTSVAIPGGNSRVGLGEDNTNSDCAGRSSPSELGVPSKADSDG